MGVSSMVRNKTPGNVNRVTTQQRKHLQKSSSLQMNFFDDAFRYFSQLNKEASAKHILIKGENAVKRCNELKGELAESSDVSVTFSELAAKYSECPSANRGGNLGTFKPGMMVKEFDEVCFNRDVGVVHGPVETQFGAHLILVTRRYEGEDKK
jgi:peptidyl-prolyl cis-trans isomerase C